jgi:hypothetical protein
MRTAVSPAAAPTEPDRAPDRASIRHSESDSPRSRRRTDARESTGAGALASAPKASTVGEERLRYFGPLIPAFAGAAGAGAETPPPVLLLRTPP